jgi:hypothetical protein
MAALVTDAEGGGALVPVVAVDLGAGDDEALGAYLAGAGAAGLLSPAQVRAEAMRRLVEAGLAPMSAEHPPPLDAAPGWHAALGADRLHLIRPGETVYDGALVLPPGMESALAEAGHAVVMVGHLRLGLGADVMAAALEAGARGECAAGVVPVTLARAR